MRRVSVAACASVTGPRLPIETTSRTGIRRGTNETAFNYEKLQFECGTA